MSFLTAAFCTYNRSKNLPGLVAALRNQECRIPFEVLVVNNNSTDDTARVLQELASAEGAPFRFVTEKEQGIVAARNRALQEARGNDYLVFMDDDEHPRPGFLEAAVDAFETEAADCVGGAVKVFFEPGQRPPWLGDELLGFLAEVDYGEERFWIEDTKTPLWTANVGYRMALFKDGLRFDSRYTRKGKGIGGGSDLVMFQALLERGVRMRYRPDMIVDHFVEDWRLRRSYFLKLHYLSGRRRGRFELPDYTREIFGVPPFLLGQAVNHWVKAGMMWARREPGVLRQAMNGAHALGLIAGRAVRRGNGSTQ